MAQFSRLLLFSSLVAMGHRRCCCIDRLSGQPIEQKAGGQWFDHGFGCCLPYYLGVGAAAVGLLLLAAASAEAEV